MGCEQSKGVADALIELAPRFIALPEPKLDKVTLVNGLAHVARFLTKSNAQITIVAVGGAVNTIFLESRESTHDIDFFGPDLSKSDFKLVVAAAKYAQSKDSSLPKEWINNRTVLFMSTELRESLIRDAIAQDEIIFDEPGLKVLAAPWNYACAAKLDRMARGGSGVSFRHPAV
jgi:hypothetical protein